MLTGRTTKLLILLLFLPGCGTLPYPTKPLADYLQGAPDARTCIGYYTNLDHYAVKHGMADIQATRVPGFPFLRMNRFLASFADEPMSVEQETVWLRQLAKLDLDGRQVELAEMPWPELQQIMPQTTDRETALENLQDCSHTLQARLLRNKSAMQDLRSRLNVPDDYLDILRVVGLYPVSSLPVMWGVEKLHEQTRMRLEAPFTASGHEIKTYVAADSGNLANGDIEHLIAAAGDNALGLPLFSNAQASALFRHFAPVLEIETATGADFPGQPVWRDDRTIAVDTTKPVVYTHLSRTRFYKRILVQLNYTIWFPERPLEGRFDLLGGHLDGITWRVTLDSSGQPLFYDVIHNCGCYHIVFAPTDLQHVEKDGFWQEPLLVLPLPSADTANGKAVLSLASGTHYLAHVGFTGGEQAATRYTLADYDQLRQLPYHDAVRRSMFDSRGLVPGSERAERWVLWPMGVPEPGAMRQWGHHAIAFIGKRHFDDPFLWEHNFKRPR